LPFVAKIAVSTFTTIFTAPVVAAGFPLAVRDAGLIRSTAVIGGGRLIRSAAVIGGGRLVRSAAVIGGGRLIRSAAVIGGGRLIRSAAVIGGGRLVRSAAIIGGGRLIRRAAGVSRSRLIRDAFIAGACIGLSRICGCRFTGGTLVTRIARRCRVFTALTLALARSATGANKGNKAY
jgi:NDP-sugar pyrophosphorylase family protein